MKKLFISSMLLGSLTMAAAIPASAEGSVGTQANSVPRAGITGTYDGTVGRNNNTITPYMTPYSNNGINTNRSTLNGTSTYGTYGTYGAHDGTRMNTYNVNGTRTHTNAYRAAATTTRTFSWGWLGLLGLFGLAGMRSGNRGDVR